MPSSISIQPVRTRRDWNQFFGLRRAIYRSDPAFVFPLNSIERALVDPRRHPFYEHAERECFVARRGKQVVGRVAAIQDFMHNEYHQDRLGFFGFFESIDDSDVARVLLDRASDWLRNRNCDRVRGPVNPSMKSDFGVQIEGQGVPSSVMLAYTPRYYDRLLTEYGFEKALDFYAYLFDKGKDYDRARQDDPDMYGAKEKILRRYPQARVGDCPPDQIDQTLREINRLANMVRSQGFGFVPLTEPELEFMIRQVRRVVRPDTILCGYWEDQLVAYCVNIPDVNLALHRCRGRWDWVRMPQLLFQLNRIERTRVIAVGVHPEYRNRGIGVLVTIEMRNRGMELDNFQQWDFSWVAENNIRSIRNIARVIPMDRYKTFRLYEKRLD